MGDAAGMGMIGDTKYASEVGETKRARMENQKRRVMITDYKWNKVTKVQDLIETVGTFHTFGIDYESVHLNADSGLVGHRSVAIIELDDGSVVMAALGTIKFIDA